MKNLELYASILIMTLTTFLGFLQWRSGTRVQDADRTEKIGNAYDKLLDALQEQVTKLDARVAYLETELKKQTNWNARLVRQLAEAGLKPVPFESEPKITT